jgi:hypothetical protein
MAEYFKHHAIKYLKPKTVQGYLDSLRAHILPRLAATPADLLTSDAVRRMLTEIAAKTPGAARFTKKALSVAYEWGKANRGLSTNPCAAVAPDQRKAERRCRN